MKESCVCVWGGGIVDMALFLVGGVYVSYMIPTRQYIYILYIEQYLGIVGRIC